tara:strand:- start:238 stop:573 length:336 start_codon:yes stop_codon:yes gene_type:complete
MIIVPGKDGDFGVLPGHSKLMSSLRPGRIMIYSEDKNLLKSFFVSGGFAEVNPEKCIILAESVDDMSVLDKSIIQNSIQDLEKLDDLKSKEQLLIANAKLDAMNSIFYNKI